MTKRNGYFDVTGACLIFLTLCAFFMVGALIHEVYLSNKHVTCLTLYDYKGQPLRQWAGEFVLHREQYGTYFDIDGKRVVIRGGIVVAE